MKNRVRVLVIDDDLISRKYISKALRDNHEVITAINGEQGLELAKKERPDVIFLDVEMPGINGFETCDKLKNDPSTKHIPVLFLSGRGSLRERMLGYEVGADDYFVKPFEKDELLAKISVLMSYQQRHDVLLTQCKTASDTAMTAIKGSGELGHVMGFVDRSYKIENFDELAYLLIQTLAGFQLNTCIALRCENQTLYYGSNGDVKPLEKELITMLWDNHRFHDFGCRTQINYPKVSILIKNMPIDDMDKYGRYKDFLTPILTATDDKITIIDAHKALYDQTKDLNNSMEVVKATLTEITGTIEQNHANATKIMQDMFESLEDNVPRMGMEDDQEAFVLNIVEHAIQDVIKLQDKGNEAVGSFKLLMSAMQHLATKQKKLIDRVFIREESVDHFPSSDDDTGELGIDLF